MKQTLYTHVSIDADMHGAYRPGADKPTITAVRVDVNERHAHMYVFNRGALAGTLIVEASDMITVLDRLLPPAERREASLR